LGEKGSPGCHGFRLRTPCVSRPATPRRVPKKTEPLAPTNPPHSSRFPERRPLALRWYSIERARRVPRKVAERRESGEVRLETREISFSDSSEKSSGWGPPSDPGCGRAPGSVGGAHPTRLPPPYRDLPIDIDPVENRLLHAAPNEPIGHLGLRMFVIVRLHERHFTSGRGRPRWRRLGCCCTPRQTNPLVI
jgi:hypothetical protein